MKAGLHIHVASGTVSIGAVSQGDAARVCGSAAASHAASDARAEQATLALTALAREQHRSAQELREVLAHLAELRQAAAQPQPDVVKGRSLLKRVREDFSWAYTPVKDFVLLAWPALLALIGAG